MTTPSTSERDPAPGQDPATRSPAAPEKASIFEDFIDIFYAPSQVFARRMSSGFWVPMLIVTVLIGLVYFVNADVMEPVMDAEFERGMAAQIRDNPQLTPEAVERARQFSGTFAKVGVFVVTPIMIFLIGLVLWMVGKFFDAKQTLTAAVMVAAYSYVPRIVEGVLARVQALLIDPESLDGRFRLTLGVGRFLDPDTTSAVLLAILGRVDVFTIWVTVLLAIGLAVTGKISRGSAAIAAAVVWVAGALPGVMGALRQG